MKFRILHKSKGRMRIAAAKNRMSMREADILLYYIEGTDGVARAAVHERTACAVIYYDEGKREGLINALREFSYDNTDFNELVPDNTGRELNRYYQERLVNMVIFKLARDIFMPSPWQAAYTVFKSVKYIWKGICCLLRRKLEVEVLDALSVGISILRADCSTAASVMFLLGLGSQLEEWTHKKSVDDLARSMSLNIDKVWMKTGEGDVLVPVSKVKAGDIIIVRTGNIIPIDGTVVSGEAMVNQASLTGESVPVAKHEGAYAYAGTVIEEGECLIRAEMQSGQGRYDRIVSMIEESEKLKSNTESRAASLADRLVPYSLAGTALTYLLTGNVTRAVSVLMVDFSCALKLAMPLSVLSAMREAGGYNITVKGGKYLEAVAKADTIVFDKTGTLTYASPGVAKVIPAYGRDEYEMLKIAACLEEHYPHSMAKAVVRKAAELGISHAEMHTQVEYVVAHGISSMIDGERVIIGSRHFVFEDEGCELTCEDEGMLDSLENKYSHLYMAIGGRLAAVICIYDPLRAEAAEVLASLKRLGIKKTVMMTGDNERTASAIASEVGVDEYYSEVLPEDKAEFVEKEKSGGSTVIMIGDGINDSPALSAADCGIAISDGAAIAREIADITISADNLDELVKLKLISDGLMKRVEYNYRFVIGFNAGLILFGAMGLLAPTTSALLHNLSTIGISAASMTDLLKK